MSVKIDRPYFGTIQIFMATNLQFVLFYFPYWTYLKLDVHFYASKWKRRKGLKTSFCSSVLDAQISDCALASLAYFVFTL